MATGSSLVSTVLMGGPSTAPSAFTSVKLPASLVQQAKVAAKAMRRSAAGQIEYWAALGRVVEHSGLTVQEAREAIEAHEDSSAPDQADELIGRFTTMEANGRLAQCVRDVVLANRANAFKKAA